MGNLWYLFFTSNSGTYFLHWVSRALPGIEILTKFTIHTMSTKTSIRPKASSKAVSGALRLAAPKRAPIVQRKRPSNPVSNRLPKNNGPTTHIRQAEQFIDPGRFATSVLVPDRSAKRRCTRRFQKVVAINSAMPGATTGFTVVARPSLSMPFATSGASRNVPTSAGAYTVKGHVRILSSANQKNAGDSFQAVANNGQQGVGRLVYDAVHNLWELTASNTATEEGDAVLTYHSHVPDGGSAVIETFRETGAAWVSLSKQLASVNDTVLLLGATANTKLGFRFTSVVGDQVTLRYSYAIGGVSTGQVALASGIDLPSGDFMEEFSNVAEGGRLTAMSLLVTNTSPNTANGGDVFAARVPSDVPYYTTPANMKKSCPDMYNGKADKGAYVWWLPSEEAAQSYADLDQAVAQLADDNYLWVTVEGWGGDYTSSAMITFTWVVEFFAESQMYEKHIPPPRDDAWELTFQTLARLPSATCNPSHKELFRSFLGGAKEAYNKASSHYSRNKTLYDLLLQSMMAALS